MPRAADTKNLTFVLDIKGEPGLGCVSTKRVGITQRFENSTFENSTS